MKKRLLAVLCAVMLLCTVFPISASAAGSIEGVDYDRIKGTAGGKEVILTLGDLQFHGELTNGSLNDEERDKIIRQAMNDMKITSGMLINAESLIDKAQNVQGFGTGDVINAAAKLVGVSDLLEIYNYFMGSGKDPEKIAKDIATSQVTDAAKEKLEDVLTDGGTLVLKGAGKFAFKLLFILPDLTEIGLDALTKYEDIKYTVTLGTEKMVMLEAFYQACNDRIAEKEKELGGWVIRFDKATATDTFTFWGISGLMSEWTLSGELVKGISGAGDGVTGNYEGTLTLSMKALDMAETFDRNWVQNTTEWPSIMRVLKSGDKLTDTPQQTTKLERTISGDFNLYIPGESSGIYEPAVFGSFNGADTIDFSFSRKAESSYSGYTDGSNTLIYGANLTSINVNTVYFEGYHTFPTIMGSAGTGPDTWAQSTGDLDMNVGTVWDPLDGEVSMEINFGK